MPEKINYRAVLKDLRDQHKKLGIAIEAIESLVSTSAREKAALSETPFTITPARNGSGPHEVTMLDATQRILAQAGKPLHAKEIVAKLNSEYGKSTNPNSLAARLPQDKDKRFKNIGSNNWSLTVWAEK